MATIIDELIIQLGLDTEKLSDGEKKAVGSLRRLEENAKRHVGSVHDDFKALGSQLGSLQNRLLGIAAIFLSGMGLSQFTQHVAQVTNQLSRMSTQFGLTVRELSAWGHVGGMAGVNPGSVQGAVAAFGGALYSNEQNVNSQLIRSLAAMNIRPQIRPDGSYDVNGMLLDMSKWATAPGRRPEQAQATLTQVPGINNDLANLLLQGPEKLKAQLAEMAKQAPTEKQTAAVNKLVESWGRMTASAEKLANVLLEKLEPVLTKIIEFMDRAFKFWNPDSEERSQLERDFKEGVQSPAGATWDWLRGKFGGKSGGSSSAPPPAAESPGTPAPSFPGAHHSGLAADRAKYAAELKANPALREKVMAIAAGENSNPRGAAAVIESMMNRASMGGISLEEAARLYGRESKGYYAGYNPAGLRANRERYEGALAAALGGSNYANFGTDNASNQPGNALARRDVMSGRFEETAVINGEHFMVPRNLNEPRRNRRLYEAWRSRVQKGDIDRYWAGVPTDSFTELNAASLGLSARSTVHNNSSQTQIDSLNVYAPSADPYDLALGVKRRLQNSANMTQATTGPN